MQKINFKELVKPYENDALNLLIKDLKINSIYDETTVTHETPYGKGVRDCFDLLKEVALNDGFTVDTCDNRCLEVSYGEGKNLIYVFCHQDVVPVGPGWTSDPFTPTIRDNKLYARGTSDDKGPGISAYYALKALKDNNLIDDYRVRLVFGGDEERGSSCLEYYFHTLKKEDPTYGFTPDGDFPLIYGEKGICNYYYDGEIKENDVISIKGGEAINSVIDLCEVKVKDSKKLDEYLSKHTGIKFHKNDENTFIFEGVASHGSLPELGVNAGLIALSVLGDCYLIPEFSLLANEYENPFGKNLYCYFESKDLGKTTYNVGLIDFKDNKLHVGVNFRYPETVNPLEVISKIKKESPFKITVGEPSKVLFYDLNTPFIQTLYEVYKEETGDLINKPLTIGGGTYAKEAKNTVAFGSHFVGKEDNIHGKDEKIDIEDFYLSMSLYASAIYHLGKLKNEN